MGKLKNIIGLAAASVTASVESIGVDVADAGSLFFNVCVGDFTFTGVNKVSIKLQHSDDNITFVDCVDADIFEAEDGANGVYKLLDDVADKESLYSVHYLGNKRYARIALVVAGTVACPMSINAIQGHLETMPA